MPDGFQYDGFLNHCAKDKGVVRAVAERLRADGLMVWFDEWVLKPGHGIPAKIEEGLEHSRVLVLCMSANAFGRYWVKWSGGPCLSGNRPMPAAASPERAHQSKTQDILREHES